MRFFYTVPLHRQPFILPLPKGVKKLPEVLSREEGGRLVASTATLREGALLMATSGGGLRGREVVRLRVSAIDAERGVLRVEQGKGRKDRSTRLGPRLLAAVRHYGQVYRPAPPWLFPQRPKAVPLEPTTAQKRYYAAKRRAGISKGGGIHALRPATAQASGSLGKSSSQGVVEDVPTGPTQACPGGVFVIDAQHGGFGTFTNTYANGDQLYSQISTRTLCADSAGGFSGSDTGVIVGGTGKFAGASGTFEQSYTGFFQAFDPNANPAQGFGSFTGQSTGTLIQP